jgi:hypothetical protein
MRKPEALEPPFLTFSTLYEQRPPSENDIQRQLDQATRFAREGFNAPSRYRPAAAAPQAPPKMMKSWGGKDVEDYSFEFQHSLLQKLDRVKKGLPEGQQQRPIDASKQGEARSHASGSSSSVPALPKGIPKQAPPPTPSCCLSQFIKVPEPRKPYAIPKKSEMPPTKAAAPQQSGSNAKAVNSKLQKRLTFDCWKEYEETLSPVVLDEVAAEMWQAKDEADAPVPASAVQCILMYVCIYIYIYIYIHTHTHTHAYTYIYIYVGREREENIHFGIHLHVCKAKMYKMRHISTGMHVLETTLNSRLKR